MHDSGRVRPCAEAASRARSSSDGLAQLRVEGPGEVVFRDRDAEDGTEERNAIAQQRTTSRAASSAVACTVLGSSVGDARATGPDRRHAEVGTGRAVAWPRRRHTWHRALGEHCAKSATSRDLPTPASAATPRRGRVRRAVVDRRRDRCRFRVAADHRQRVAGEAAPARAGGRPVRRRTTGAALPLRVSGGSGVQRNRAARARSTAFRHVDRPGGARPSGGPRG